MSKGPPLDDGASVLMLLLIVVIAAGGLWWIADLVWRLALLAIAAPRV